MMEISPRLRLNMLFMMVLIKIVLSTLWRKPLAPSSRVLIKNDMILTYALNVKLNEFQTNLVPNPRIHYLLVT